QSIRRRLRGPACKAPWSCRRLSARTAAFATSNSSAATWSSDALPSTRSSNGATSLTSSTARPWRPRPRSRSTSSRLHKRQPFDSTHPLVLVFHVEHCTGLFVGIALYVNSSQPIPGRRVKRTSRHWEQLLKPAAPLNSFPVALDGGSP